jgi:DNA mismatch repair ATPase MutS
LFKFEPGTSKSSFGLSIAEMAGLPEILLEKAEIISMAFDQVI